MIEGEEYQPFPGIAVWNLLFLKGDRTSWWDFFTEPEWRHVCAYAYVPSMDCWVIYDVAQQGSFISVVDPDWFMRWCRIRHPRVQAIVEMPILKDTPSPRARIGLWCVTAVKHLVGLPTGALRPKALYRDCLRHGGKDVLTERTDGRQGEASAGRPGNQSPA